MELRRWNVRHVREVLETAPDFVPFARGGDAGLGTIRAQVGPTALAALASQARADAVAPIPALPASLYLEFLRNGGDFELNG